MFGQRVVVGNAGARALRRKGGEFSTWLLSCFSLCSVGINSSTLAIATSMDRGDYLELLRLSSLARLWGSWSREAERRVAWP